MIKNKNQLKTISQVANELGLINKKNKKPTSIKIKKNVAKKVKKKTPRVLWIRRKKKAA